MLEFLGILFIVIILLPLAAAFAAPFVKFLCGFILAMARVSIAFIPLLSYIYIIGDKLNHTTEGVILFFIALALFFIMLWKNDLIIQKFIIYGKKVYNYFRADPDNTI